MRKIIAILSAAIMMIASATSYGGDTNAAATPKHLQEISVTIQSQGGTGSGVLFTRKDAQGAAVSTIQSRDKNRPHPATFPKELPAMCFKLHGLREDLIGLDPFLGIGNSALAAQELGLKKFIGFDIDPSYIAIAREKVSQPPLITQNL